MTRPTKDWIKIITTHLRRHISDLNLIHLTYLITRDLIIQYRELEGLFPLNRAKANVIRSMTIKIYVLGPNSVLDPMECWNNLGFHLVNFVPTARGTSPCHLLIVRHSIADFVRMPVIVGRPDWKISLWNYECGFVVYIKKPKLFFYRSIFNQIQLIFVTF